MSTFLTHTAWGGDRTLRSVIIRDGGSSRCNTIAKSDPRCFAVHQAIVSSMPSLAVLAGDLRRTLMHTSVRFTVGRFSFRRSSAFKMISLASVTSRIITAFSFEDTSGMTQATTAVMKKTTFWKYSRRRL